MIATTPRHSRTLVRLLHAFERVEISPLDRHELGDRATICNALRYALTLVDAQERPAPVIGKDGRTKAGRRNPLWA